MVNYRHTIYRYSTGQGPNFNVDVPKYATQYSSFKLEPLRHRLSNEEFTVNLVREADRVSMQVEAAAQQIKVLGYNREVGPKYRNLKNRLELIKYILFKYPIKYIRIRDLNILYEIFNKGKLTPDAKRAINRILDANKNTGGVYDYLGSIYRSVNKKRRIEIDSEGIELNKSEQQIYKKGKQSLGEFDDKKKYYSLILVIIALYLFLRKKI